MQGKLDEHAKRLRLGICVQEKTAMKQQKQEEKASQKASKEAARVLLKQEKERLKVEKGSSRTPSMDRSGSRPLLMKRQGSVQSSP